MLVSEVMLQQTQVARVLERYPAFLERFPTPAATADEPLGAVLREWQGLGYPRRARNLHAAARRCVELHDGSLPDDLVALEALPGVGAYTARAVLAFAFERDVGVVDTNIARVLARRAGSRLTPREAQRSADEAVPEGDGWEWNQSLMDLGASACRPRPSCRGCPIECAWRVGGYAEPDPAIASAHVSRRQAPFVGSDRQARGRLLAALGASDLVDDPATVAAAAGLDGEPVRALDLISALIAEGLVARRDDMLTLP